MHYTPQIRSYVLQPYTRVKDLRTAVETENVTAVLDGDIDIFLEAAIKQGLGKRRWFGNSAVVLD